MSQDSNCVVCLSQLFGNSKLPTCTLKCHPKHVFHIKCMKEVYWNNYKRFVDNKPLIPEGPACREPFKYTDCLTDEELRRQKRAAQDMKNRSRLLQLAKEPLFAAQNPEKRPIRLARQIVCMEKKRREIAIGYLGS